MKLTELVETLADQGIALFLEQPNPDVVVWVHQDGGPRVLAIEQVLRDREGRVVLLAAGDVG